MNKRPVIRIFLLLVFTVSSGSFSCSRPVEFQTNALLDQASSEAMLEARLAKTKEVRRVFDEVRKSLRPIDELLDRVSLAMAADKTLREVSRGDIRIFTRRLEESLNEVSRGMVEIHEDGSWKMERRIAEEAAGIFNGCDRPVMSVKGQATHSPEDGENPENQENMKMFIQCGNSAPLTIAQVSAHLADDLKNKFEAEFYTRALSLLGSITDEEGKMGGLCSLFSDSSDLDVQCQPIELALGDTKMQILDFELKKHSDQLLSTSHMRLFDKNQALLAEIEVDTRAGLERAISIRKNGS